MTEALRATLNDIAAFTKNSNHEIRTERAETSFEEWYPHIDSNAVRTAFEFFKAHDTDAELHYPPGYVKGKNGSYYEHICYIPEQDGYDDYARYKGVYADLNFREHEIVIYVDGSETSTLGSIDDVNEFFEENSWATAYELFLKGIFCDSRSLFKAFMEAIHEDV